MNNHYEYIYYVATVAILHFDGQMFQRPITHGHTNEQTAAFLHFYVARAQFRLLFEDATMPMWAGGSVDPCVERWREGKEE